MRRLIAFVLTSLAAVGLADGGARALDWPQFRGPTRDGISLERGWSHRWAGGAPRKVWSAEVGVGFSSVAVSDGRLYTMGNRGEQDVVSCLDAATGRVIWQHRYRCSSGDYPGPRATPTVTGGRVYTLSREGQAWCLDAKTGKPVWNRSLGQQAPGWGFASSPLVQGSLVLYNAGAAGMALDTASGRVAWDSGPGTAGYASPVAFAAGGRSGVAIFAGNALVALDPRTGRQMWRHPWSTSFDVNAADPVFWGDSVFISSNYGKGGALLRLAGGRPSVAWETREMRNHINTSVLVNGHLYGNDENTLKCIDARTGREKWRMRGMDKGGLIASDGRLIVLTGRGELVVVAANPNAFTELARAPVLRGTCWTHPVLANGMLYCRSQEGTLVCLDLRS